MEFPSELIEEAVKEISKLPGIGKKTALRLALHLLKEKEAATQSLTESLLRLRKDTQYCGTCHVISHTTDCTCRTINRDVSVICVVVDTPDLLAIRSTGQYQGMFHVLGGVISPIEGIGPEDLHIQSLVDRIQAANGEVKEVILALSATMEGDTTCFYLSRKLEGTGVKISTIARGIPVGGELEYADEVTLGRSIVTRTNYSSGSL
ncbi:recombination mediator RecR [Reichenbachiella carrageenanivorans]|uniref:Recombination protein RecR n=1 Tax=Reichenbachiella carrageenanivorans TaxID=2979869 RepID=A0ABY6D3C2_9BACT|nr:recombination mediator RecR [Reichenbachiella carrageenanivorans]UXX78335.1 recombination mediator RecR [Reichenbachiella carrageenanivorans]